MENDAREIKSKEVERHWSRVDALGTEFRRLFMVVATGLFVGGLLKGESSEVSGGTSLPTGGLNLPIAIIGLAALVVLGNILHSKSRSIALRDELLEELGESVDRKYIGSVASLDAVALVLLTFGIIFLSV
jgi:hypothetical protein